ncbi:HNH endonuclease signature motif containing protein [Pseudomonas chlororaphis]|uniref:HNH endonuclease signature motif containing protein n=1 Tax=Pseudomonas chlororaphis TaxID=587753 RepID=UPI001B307188|nr:HNH endonuclease signature motif containing protein [Pseudomonas chlororaphis]MBP5059624.1 HNH endonuclease [Pseudomonas chlororaphis]MBP5143074.1 HNH endonuclease [Pseudomonas chlororaphis]QTU03292.1 HNH endonuclease [Pseudomonas chlororaphis]
MYYPLQSSRPQRRTTVQQRARYSLYKPELREDFVSKCGYCDTPDYYSGGKRGFHIDHFAPKSKFEQLKNEYTNLVYCCPICNIGKSDDWPGDNPSMSFMGDIGYIDPCSENYADHLARSPDGTIVALTPLGGYIHKRLKLSLRRRQICWLMERMEEQMTQLARLAKDKQSELGSEEVQTLCELTLEYFKYAGFLKRE